jgi:hypothetical protein
MVIMADGRATKAEQAFLQKLAGATGTTNARLSEIIGHGAPAAG